MLHNKLKPAIIIAVLAFLAAGCFGGSSGGNGGTTPVETNAEIFSLLNEFEQLADAGEWEQLASLYTSPVTLTIHDADTFGEDVDVDLEALAEWLRENLEQEFEEFGLDDVVIEELDLWRDDDIDDLIRAKADLTIASRASVATILAQVLFVDHSDDMGDEDSSDISSTISLDRDSIVVSGQGSTRQATAKVTQTITLYNESNIVETRTLSLTNHFTLTLEPSGWKISHHQVLEQLRESEWPDEDNVGE